jgi:ferrous iron transport protein B
MELPPYHMPALRGCLEHVGHNVRSFLTRAGAVIVTIAVVLSLANALFDKMAGGGADERRAAAGRVLTLALRPMGVSEENWPAAAGLLTGLMAKETIVGTLEVLYAHADGHADATEEPFSLKDALGGAVAQLAADYGLRAKPDEEEEPDVGLLASMRRNFGDRSAAFAYLLFILIYSPCVAALIVLGREAGWRWMGFAVLYQTLLAWMVATAYYQIATFAEAPLRSAGWLGVVAAMAAAGIGLMRVAGKRVAE